MSTLWGLLWIFILLLFLLPRLQHKMLGNARIKAIKVLQDRRGSRVITLIQRHEALAFLGFPFSRFINIEDSEQILRAIRTTDDDTPIDIILHTPGGLVLATEQIALALARHKAKVTALIPHYAMSGGTMIALAAEEIIMDENAVLGPLDPQIGKYPAASILQAIEQKDKNEIDDETLILADIARKAISQIRSLIKSLLSDRVGEDKASEISRVLTEGRWTHDCPLTFHQIKELGLSVRTGLPEEIYKLMSLYPQPVGVRPSVQYIPVPYQEKRTNK